MSASLARYAAADLIAYARALFLSAGCDDDKASRIAEILVEADLLGHTTHGLALAADYLEQIESGAMRTTGQPRVVAQNEIVTVWDGEYLPGIWLTVQGLDLACERAQRHGMGAVAIRRSHHIACLEAYLPRATQRGLLALITSSDPSAASVAPYGGRKPVFTPDPVAVGIPTGGDPILIDMSASITTNGLSARLSQEGKRYPGLWAQDAEGHPSDDPRVVFANPPGSILSAGGLDHGHKGYALALIVEALTQGLGGYGRADGPTQWGASVYIQVWDPRFFGGRAAFEHEMTWTAEACRTNPPVREAQSVRLPGEAGLNRKGAALSHGVSLYPGVWETLAPWAKRFGLRPPDPLTL